MRGTRRRRLLPTLVPQRTARPLARDIRRPLICASSSGPSKGPEPPAKSSGRRSRPALTRSSSALTRSSSVQTRSSIGLILIAMVMALVGLRGAPALAQVETTGSARLSGARPISRPRVVLLSVTDDDPLAARLAAELGDAGARGRARPDRSDLPIDDLVRQALAGGARGVVVADGRRTEFWVAEEGSDHVAMRQELEIENSPAMESVLSLRTVEFLRVSLGLVGRAVPPPRRRAARRPGAGGGRYARRVQPDVGRRREHRPAGAVRTVSAALRVRIVGPVGIELRGLAPFGRQSIAGPAGPDRYVGVARRAAGWCWRPGPSAPSPSTIGVGALAVMVRGSGAAAAPTAGPTRRSGSRVYGRAAGRIQPQPELVGPPRRDRGKHRARGRISSTATAQTITTWGARLRLPRWPA